METVNVHVWAFRFETLESLTSRPLRNQKYTLLVLEC